METRASSSLKIVQAGEPVLRQRAREVDPVRIATPEFQALVVKMVEAMRAAPGVGLAAPQVGVSERIIVLEDSEALAARLSPAEREERKRVPFPVRVFVNPRLTVVGSERAPERGAEASFFEGCLSVNGYAGIVTRALEVEVSGLDEHGKPQTWRVAGWPARILQHEVDHLDGTLYVDRMMTRSFMTAEHAKARFAGKPMADIRRELGI